MRRRKKPILALLLTTATLITACSSPKGETTMTTPESTASSTSASTAPTTTPPATSEPIEVPYADGSEITLTNKRDAIGLAVRGNELIITSLGAKQGENRIVENSVFALPQTATVDGVATEPEWSFVGVARMRAAAMIGAEHRDCGLPIQRRGLRALAFGELPRLFGSRRAV